MASLSDYAEAKLGDHLLATASFTMPVQVYLGLYTAAPSDAGGGTEVSGGAYARLAVDFDAVTSGTGTTDLTATATFVTATANWGTISHVGLFDAVSGGNLLMWGALAATKEILNGDTFQILAADLDVTFA